MPKVKKKGGADGAVVAMFQGKAMSKKASRDSLESKQCIVLVSVSGNKYCQGEFFESIVVSALKEFSKVIFLIVDKPNRYNLTDQLSQTENRQVINDAITLGSKWFNNNKEAFKKAFDNSDLDETFLNSDSSVSEKINYLNHTSKKHGKNFIIQQWEDWVLGKEIAINDFRNKLLSIATVRKKIEEAALSYASRHGSSSEIPNKMKLSQGYLMEETFGVIYTAIQDGWDFIAYPGKIIPPFEATINYLYQDKSLLSHLKTDFKDLNWLYISFKKGMTNGDLSLNKECVDIRESLTQQHDPIKNTRISLYLPLANTMILNMYNTLRKEGISEKDSGHICGAFAASLLKHLAEHISDEKILNDHCFDQYSSLTCSLFKSLHNNDSEQNLAADKESTEPSILAVK